MAGALAGLRFVPFAGATWTDSLVELASTVTVGLVVFLGTSRVLRMGELGWLLRR